MENAALKKLGVTSDDIRDMQLRAFNKLISNCDSQSRATLKRLRRRLRNRGYANNARVRRDGETQQYESECNKLRKRGEELRREIRKEEERIAATRAKLEVVENLNRRKSSAGVQRVAKTSNFTGQRVVTAQPTQG